MKFFNGLLVRVSHFSHSFFNDNQAFDSFFRDTSKRRLFKNLFNRGAGQNAPEGRHRKATGASPWLWHESTDKLRRGDINKAQ